MQGAQVGNQVPSLAICQHAAPGWHEKGSAGLHAAASDHTMQQQVFGLGHATVVGVVGRLGLQVDGIEAVAVRFRTVTHHAVVRIDPAADVWIPTLQRHPVQVLVLGRRAEDLERRRDGRGGPRLLSLS